MKRFLLFIQRVVRRVKSNVDHDAHSGRWWADNQDNLHPIQFTVFDDWGMQWHILSYGVSGVRLIKATSNKWDAIETRDWTTLKTMFRHNPQAIQMCQWAATESAALFDSEFAFNLLRMRDDMAMKLKENTEEIKTYVALTRTLDAATDEVQ